MQDREAGHEKQKQWKYKSTQLFPVLLKNKELAESQRYDVIEAHG